MGESSFFYCLLVIFVIKCHSLETVVLYGILYDKRYDVFVRSYETVAIVSAVIGLIRFKKEKSKK